MNAKRQLSLMLLGLSLMTGLSVVGSTVGTLAWYAYNTKVTAAYQGTSVAKTEQLQVGLVDDYSAEYGWHLSDSYIASHSLTKEVVSATRHIVWAHAGAGLAAQVIEEFVKNSAYENNSLSPLSSRGYEEDGTFNLYNQIQKSTTIDYHDNPVVATFKREYVQIPFAFKVTSQTGVVQADRNVWITDVETKALTAGKKTDKAIRAFFENVSTNKSFLLNPSSTSLAAGSTRIAGVLDLNGDGWYDYDLNTNKEIVYGQYDDDELTNGHISWSDTPYVPGEPYEVDDVNNVGDNTPSTFVAKHKEGVYVADYTNLEYTTAYYDTLNTIKPVLDNATGQYVEDSGKPVATTNSSGIGFTNLTIYLEGWDFATVNSIIDTQFNFGIQFQINRI